MTARETVGPTERTEQGAVTGKQDKRLCSKAEQEEGQVVKAHDNWRPLCCESRGGAGECSFYKMKAAFDTFSLAVSASCGSTRLSSNVNAGQHSLIKIAKALRNYIMRHVLSTCSVYLVANTSAFVCCTRVFT